MELIKKLRREGHLLGLQPGKNTLQGLTAALDFYHVDGARRAFQAVRFAKHALDDRYMFFRRGGILQFDQASTNGPEVLLCLDLESREKLLQKLFVLKPHVGCREALATLLRSRIWSR